MKYINFDELGSDLLEGKGVITIPIDTVFDGYLDIFKSKIASHESTQFYHPSLCSKNFKRHPLVPGKTYQVEAVEIRKKISVEECLEYHRIHEHVLAGADGLFLFKDLAPSLFPKGKQVVSLDLQEGAYTNTVGGLWFPQILNRSRGSRYSLGHYGRPLFPESALLCFKAIQAI